VLSDGNKFMVNNLKKRGVQVETIPVTFKDEASLENLIKNGKLVLEYALPIYTTSKEFGATQSLTFTPIQNYLQVLTDHLKPKVKEFQNNIKYAT
jgi:hypothetical protein